MEARLTRLESFGRAISDFWFRFRVLLWVNKDINESKKWQKKFQFLVFALLVFFSKTAFVPVVAKLRYFYSQHCQLPLKPFSGLSWM